MRIETKNCESYLIIYYNYNTPFNLKIMVFPLNNNTDPYHSFTYYQAIITSELIATLSIFIILQSIHYFIWGHD